MAVSEWCSEKTGWPRIGPRRKQALGERHVGTLSPAIGPEGFEHGSDVPRGGRLTARDADVVVVDQAEQHAAGAGAGHDFGGPARHVHQNGVEELPMDEVRPVSRNPAASSAALPCTRRAMPRSPSAPWYTAYMEATTANRTWAVQMFDVAFSRRMCCSRVCRASR